MEESNMGENSSINEKNRKLFVKIKSLMISGENMMAIKSYEE
jgi:hypothetical protein